MATYVFDVETLPNYTVVGFKNVDTAEVVQVRRNEDGSPERLRQFMQQDDATFIGFNNKSFDNIIVDAFCAGRTEVEMKRIADAVITQRLSNWMARQQFQLPQVRYDSIDLIEVAPSFVGLKAYGARMHMPLLQDMPIAHDSVITDEQRAEVDSYNVNDLDTTQELLKRLEPELMLRISISRQYGADMRSKSDSQMAEQAYITSMGLKHKDNTIPDFITYTPPAFLRFSNPELSALLKQVSEYRFRMNKLSGHVFAPDFLAGQVFHFNHGTYQLGTGGIHSTHDKSICHIAGDDIICDIDAASFYPSIILVCGFVPAALGQPFVDEYRKIYERRLEAKRTGDKVTNETLKISLNGTFGKLASKYSVLYSPDLMLAVTLTGQFTLLMLIEWLEHLGAVTLSANTDGIAIRYPRALDGQVQALVAKFSQVSGFEFEFTPYRVLAMKDVNNYIAVKPDRTLKEKGIYAPLSLKKNPTAGVCAAAVGQWLAHGTPFIETIKNAPFVDFISARNVTGGGVQMGVFLGKVVRWYQSNDPTLEPIKYKSNDNLVPKSTGARACMNIDPKGGHPADLDYDWYVDEAIRIAIATGCSGFLTPEELARVETKKTKRKPKNA